MNMYRYIGGRLLQIIFTLFLIIAIMFVIFRIMPGDPASLLIDPKMPPEAKASLRAQFGLDKPLLSQFLIYQKNIFRGEFGRSFYHGQPVFEIIMERLPNTILLFTTATILAWGLGFFLGKIIAWRRESKLELSLTFLGLLFYSIFIPWFGLIMIWVFSYKLGLFPLSGMTSAELWMRKEEISSLILTLDILHHLFLPLLVLTILSFAGAMLLTRSSMLETLKEDYILTARAIGFKEKVIRDKYAARNALLPVVTSLALSLSFSMGGGVLTETVFSWPGLGREIVTATLNYDYPLAQAAFMFLSALVLIANLIADVLYAYLDPRIKY
ncbi:MAG: ABC transporter permease [Armatimonadetes bacterium CG07_land_8_20_14_0_80_40_9]|nr:MAG: ABC transporter permease [Armatimonadetes bacterium CG07_land_8_20_14_0_80_40_9]